MTAFLETVSKNRGRPTAFDEKYLARLGGYFRQTSGRDLTRRSLQDKAYFIRCLQILFGHDPAGEIEACPLLRYLADPVTGQCRTALMAKLGRIKDEGEMIETALGACFFKAGKDSNLEEIRRAWQVFVVYAEANK